MGYGVASNLGSIVLLGLLVLIAGSILRTTPILVQAAPPIHDKNTVLCNHDFDIVNSLSQTEIQAVLDSRNSFFKDYTDPTTEKLASWVIVDRAQAYNISSRILLAMMQKESSSVWFYKDMNQHVFNKSGEDMGPAVDWVLFYGWTDRGILTQYKGFYNQVDNAAKSLAAWFANPGSKGWTVGQPHVVSDGTVTPTNRATAALYIYSPWIWSNELYYDVWNMMFGDTGDCQRLDHFPPGDLNRDGKVDIIDVSILFPCFGKTETDADWDERCKQVDINPGPNNISAGKIDLYDANTIMANWTG